MKMRQKLRRGSLLFLALLLFGVTVINTIQPTKVAAAGTGSFIADEVNERVEKKNYYMFLRFCFDVGDTKNDLSDSDVNGWDYFSNTDDLWDDIDPYSVRGNIFGPNKDATLNCEDGNNIGKAFKTLGFTDSRRVFCALHDAGLVKENTLGDDWYKDDNDCYSKEVSGGHHWDIGDDDHNKVRESFEDLVKNSKANVEGSGVSAFVTGGLAAHEEYVRYYRSFMEQCGVGEADVEITKDSYSAGDAGPDDKYQLTTVNLNDQKKGVTKDVLATGQVSSGSQVAIQAEINGNEYKFGDGDGAGDVQDWWPKALVVSCNDAIEKVRATAQAYADWLTQHPDAAGSTNADTGESVEEGPSCWSKSGPLAWLLCAALDVIDGAITLLDSWVNNLLYIDANTGYESDGVVKGHAVMRNIALLLLVPMMMFMVIGTALGFGPFDPYTVKKALPRMLVATIFIVLSLPITQFAVHLSNIVGQGIGNLILSASGVQIQSLGDILGQRGTNDTFGGLLLGGAIAASAVVSIGVIGSIALVTLVALLIGMVILVMRQVLVIVLIVLAPLAIIVWIFPGNDKLWGIWKGTFTAMLLLYPIISILLASGRFVAGLIGASN